MMFERYKSGKSRVIRYPQQSYGRIITRTQRTDQWDRGRISGTRNRPRYHHRPRDEPVPGTIPKKNPAGSSRQDGK